MTQGNVYNCVNNSRFEHSTFSKIGQNRGFRIYMNENKHIYMCIRKLDCRGIFFIILIPLKRRDINKDKENDEIHKILKLNYFSFLL